MDNDKQDHQFLDLTVVLVVIVLNPLVSVSTSVYHVNTSVNIFHLCGGLICVQLRVVGYLCSVIYHNKTSSHHLSTVDLAPSSNILQSPSNTFHLLLLSSAIIIDYDILKLNTCAAVNFNLSTFKISGLHREERCLTGCYSNGRYADRLFVLSNRIIGSNTDIMITEQQSWLGYTANHYPI